MGARFACVIFVISAVGCGSPSRAPSDAGEQPIFDAEPTRGEFGGPCSKHTDCTLGFCVEPVGNTGGLCSRTCEADDCPEGWECRTVHLPEVDLPLCIPAAQQLCLACANDEECGGASCLEIDGGGRCATPCSGQCPVGYTCAADATGAHTGSFCQPVTGSCSCNAAMDGATRSCSEMSSEGTCFGTQKCTAGTGWSACTATVPTAETCDGQDNNCNFIIDDGVGGGQACNITNANGTCPGTRACDGSSGFVCIGTTPKAEACNYADDNCNGSVDEGFPGLGSTCTDGIGGCTRYGSQRCNSAGTGIVCSAVAGSPTTELCNQIDDDCDNMVDEPFKTGAMAIGAQCASGLGVCARYGSYVCKSDGSGTECSAMAGTNSSTETCNYLDDNCDGTVDNGYRNTSTGFYDTDQNCGSCGNNCTTQFTGQNSFGKCVVGTSPQCAMQCDPNTGNLNGSTVDGCEFTLDATAIYVSGTDAAAVDDGSCGLGPTGTGNHPCKTIGYGITRAVMSQRTNVLVADGTYAEGVTLVGGKNLLGGYRSDTWERHLSTTNTVISGASVVGSHDRTVTASAITAATVFEGFIVRGSFNSKPGGNSYAIYVSGSSSALVIRNNQIVAGRGGAGSAGMPGDNGESGANGIGATSSTDGNYAATSVNTCVSITTVSGNPALVNPQPDFTVRLLPNGALHTCGGDQVAGGNGGGNKCPPSWGDNLNPKQPTEKSGGDGARGQDAAGAGGGLGGAGGDAGDDGFIYNDAFQCIIPGAATFGVDALPGGNGANATSVNGCSSGNGSVMNGEWTGGSGMSGGGGSNGGGGGGGGAGGGGFCYDCVANPANTYGGANRVGGHGGGGGAGGCGGNGGAGGMAGGGVFGIFITGGSAPTIMNNTITRGAGGNGGSGGIGGAGGLGGNGGNGGGSTLFCTDKAGRGGDGGKGGEGAGGGGGCGGASFGIFTQGVGTPTYCTNNTVSGGSAGTGGAGGYSAGAPGGAGTDGVLQGCTSI